MRALYTEPDCDHDDVGIQMHPDTTRTRCGLCGGELRMVVPIATDPIAIAADLSVRVWPAEESPLILAVVEATIAALGEEQ